MKRRGKILLLCAAVCLCFVLTGCYIAPDDVSTGGGEETANNLPFNTLAPTPTIQVTPDTVVIETQSVFGATTAPDNGSGQQGPTPTPTPQGGTAGWNDWGTVQNTDADGGTATPVPSSGTFRAACSRDSRAATRCGPCRSG